MGIGGSVSNSSSNSKETLLTTLTGEKVDINTAEDTTLKGATIASIDEDGNDNGQLNLNTNSLNVSSLNNTSNSKSLSMGASIGGSYADNNLDNFSMDFSKDSTNSKTKTLATIGEGTIQITDQVNSDTQMLNRYITDNEVDIYNISSHKGLHLELDTRLLSEDGRNEIKQEYEAMNKNMNIIAGTLPNATSDNIIEATAGEVWNTLIKYLSLGVVPSNENRGGILAEIPILTGTEDSAHKALQVVNKLSHKYNEDDYIKMEESSYYRALSAEDKKEFDGKGLYISKAPVEITQESATYQNSINGMMNSEAEAIKNGLQQTGQLDPTKPIELTIGYNPSYGFLSDLLESAVDKSGIGTTGIAKQTGEYVNNVTASRGNIGSNFAPHSQGNILIYNGIKYIQTTTGFQPVEYYYAGMDEKGNKIYETPTFVSFGSPMNKDDMNKLITDPQDKGGLGYGYSGAFTKVDDFVGESLGANSGNNTQATILEQANILNAYKLFTSDSPHGTYVCEDYAGFGVQCGYRE